MTLWMCLVSFAFAAELPEVELGWHGATGWITTRPPAGEHVAPEAPVTAELWLGEQRVVSRSSGRVSLKPPFFALVTAVRTAETMTTSRGFFAMVPSPS